MIRSQFNSMQSSYESPVWTPVLPTSAVHEAHEPGGAAHEEVKKMKTCTHLDRLYQFHAVETGARTWNHRPLSIPI